MIEIFPIKIISKQDQTIIEEFNFSELDRAFLQARYYEDLGLDIELIIPGAAQSLAIGLKSNLEQMEKLAKDCQKEIEDHH